MFLISNNNQELFKNLELIGFDNKIASKDVLIKVNLSGLYFKNHPRTDMSLLKKVVDYVYQNGGRCAISEGANEHLTDNLIASGFEDTLNYYKIKVIDIDSEDYDEVVSYGEYHYIPKCFQEYPVRIAIPSTSKREGMIFSNNIKLFFGAVPRKMYRLDDDNRPKGVPRLRLHKNLQFSVASLFLAMNSYSKFQFYINGGLSYNENIGEFIFNEIFVGNDALELDLHLFTNYFNGCEYPEYLDILKAKLSNNV